MHITPDVIRHRPVEMTGTVLNDHIGQSHAAVDVAVKLLNGEDIENYYWVDYVKVLQATDPIAFANEALARAKGHTLWYVYSPLYTTHPKVCLKLSRAFAGARTPKERIVSVRKALERPLLEEFPPSTSPRG